MSASEKLAPRRTWGSRVRRVAVTQVERALRVSKLRRPATDVAPEFDLAYVRSGPRSAHPVLVIPGGPGLGSVLPYHSLRRFAAAGDLDVIMVEHRGIGFSRLDRHGAELPTSAMTIAQVLDDLVAVLDHEGVAQATVVGSSYGSYLASSFGVRFPDRVSGMVLDSALQSTHDIALERAQIRELFWDAETPLAQTIRALARQGIEERVLLDVVRAAYELGGEALLLPAATQHLRHPHARLWRMLERYATRDASVARIPGIYEFGIAGTIGFRELHYAPAPDGLPLDPALTYWPSAHLFPAFAGEPFDLPAETPKFPWPLVVLTGDRDIRTPPAIAERVVATGIDAVLVPISNGHSALETHPIALLNAVRWLRAGAHRQLPAAAERLSALPRRGLAARLPVLITRWVSRRASRTAVPRAGHVDQYAGGVGSAG